MLPHLGRIFGIEEEAMAIILYDVGLGSIGKIGSGIIGQDGMT